MQQATSRQPGRLGRIGAGITRLRNFVVNTLFVILLLAIGVVLLNTCQSISVPADSALLINPRGVIVEEQYLADPLEDLLAAGSGQHEVEIGNIIKAIDAAAKDDRIRMILLDLDDLTWAAPAHAQSIGHALTAFKATGKKVVAYGDYFDQAQYHIASFADAVYLNPLGQVILQGFGGYNFYLKDLLDRFDVNVHVFRVGSFKSAVEPLTRNDMSAESRMAAEALLQGIWAQMLADISSNRRSDSAALQAYADGLPDVLERTEGDLARAALEHHLVDELLTADQAEVRIANEVGYRVDGQLNAIDLGNYLQAQGLTRELATSPNRIAVIVAQGMILDQGRGQGIVSSDTLIPLIRKARQDDAVKAVVLRVDSPGGSQFASEVIRQELELVQIAGKPVVASFGANAASGGYWIAATADAIFAEPTSITGSIGIFSMVPTFEKPCRITAYIPTV